ncbi:DEAD/DEAH box helicase [Hymenobacter sediminis]|uniref:DEAD/DEAH box helicase n=1 Tax=Hymenobacter sediminis TaxID=2218621 RepID=UPI000DA652BC|nr:DEAD/DEAH box helicase [Hymenobacter sediminis]RPD44145.1 DEAD/DEAH box helicase [Hymenobacter sediminis]
MAARFLSGFIGINRHSDQAIDDLNCARRDATALWALWQDTLPATRPVLLVDEQATQSCINELLTQTLDAATEEDVVLLTFSGHGTHNHRLVAHDTDLENLAETTIPMSDLAERFRQSKARHILLVLDCCFSGGAPAKVIEDGLQSRGTGFSMESAFSGRGRILLAAANVDEEAWEAAGHGLLTSALTDALQAATGPVEVGGLMADVAGRVRTEAQRLGLTQTPKWVGDIDGGFTIPPLQAGQHYYQAFPELTGLKVSANIQELSGFGLPVEVIQLWDQQFPQGLNVLQLAAVNDYRILDGESLLVVAPTSSGKTFIGELAAVKAAINTQRAVFLVPYKALANEKYEQFSALYGTQLSLRVIRCTGDYQDDTNAFVRGKYDIAVLTYEMFLNLVVKNQGTLNRIGVVILDEAQFITDPSRGINVELLLTYILSARERGITPQLVALSAVIGNTNGFEQWLRCQALITTRRPVPLEEGVIDRSGVFEYVDPETGLAQTRQLLPSHTVRIRRDKPSTQDVIVPLTQALLAQQPTAKLIVFRNIRGKAEGVAGYLATDLGLPSADALIAALPAQDRSSTSAKLRNCLRGGTAFHNSNLSREEREVVERAFRDQQGPVRVLGATTTVAAGINTPASAVILGETEFLGEDQKPFTIAEYKNMVGRAGRLGYNERGQSFIIANTPMERRQLFRHYVLGQPEAMRSSFTGGNLSTWVLRLLAQISRVDRREVTTLLANTYGGYVEGRSNPSWRSQMDAQVENIIISLIRAGIAEQEDSMLQLTLLGFACANSSLSFESILRLLHLLQLLNPATITLERMLALTQALPELDDTYTPLLKNGNKEKTWPYLAAQKVGNDLIQLYQRSLPDQLAHLRRAKRALLVEAWLEGDTLESLEQAYTNSPYVPISYGDVRRIVDATRYHFRSVVPIVQALHPMMPLEDEALNLLTARLEVGLPASALSLLKVPTLNRGEMLLLVRDGIVDPSLAWAAVEPSVIRLFGLERSQALAPMWEKQRLTNLVKKA